MIMEKVTSAKDELKIDPIQLKKAALIFRAINHKLRQQIIKFISQNGKITVNQPFYSENVNQLPAPNYDGFPLDRYLSPEPVLCFDGDGAGQQQKDGQHAAGGGLGVHPGLGQQAPQVLPGVGVQAQPQPPATPQNPLQRHDL